MNQPPSGGGQINNATKKQQKKNNTHTGFVCIVAGFWIWRAEDNKTLDITIHITAATGISVTSV